MKQKENKIPTLSEIKNLPETERMKYEIAEELGLYEKVLEGGWRSLTAKESGRIGGIMTMRRKALKKENE